MPISTQLFYNIDTLCDNLILILIESGRIKNLSQSLDCQDIIGFVLYIIERVAV